MQVFLWILVMYIMYVSLHEIIETKTKIINRNIAL